ncbi:hypothetical protein EOPP23_13270 [Endozoicomonas sp. OPT23]|uniref:hypothetical protein n=1 Tax=Endozoicomonas sp. OPT23 TaxID=2072845 RepID=UPI00129A1223|nr:hypothetical protein [Endozoicomonas sp. OPT23]MRI33960.1 hypothetical protein [Endozoicomonas sp. OPT23]
MFSIKKISEVDFGVLKGIAKNGGAAVGQHGRHSVHSVDPARHLAQLEGSVREMESRTGLANAQSVGGQHDLSTRPLVWLAEKLSCMDFKALEILSVQQMMTRKQTDEMLEELDSLKIPLEQKIQLLEMIEVNDDSVEQTIKKDIQGLLQEKSAAYKQRLSPEDISKQHQQRLDRIRQQLQQSKIGAATPPPSPPNSSPVSRPVTPPVTKRLDFVCGSLASHLNKWPDQVNDEFKDYCRILLNGTANDGLVKNGVYQGRTNWPSAQDLEQFLGSHDQSFPLKKEFIALAARCFQLPIDCEVQQGSNVLYRHYDAKGHVAPVQKDIALHLTLSEADLTEGYSLRNDDEDEAPKSLAFHNLRRPVVNSRQTLEEVLIGRGIIEKEDEYQGIIKAWGKDSSRLKSPDFPEQYRRLKQLYFESDRENRQFSFRDMAYIHKSGLLDYYKERIDSVRSGTDDMWNVYKDLDKDFGYYIDGIGTDCVNREAGIKAPLAGPAMTNWSQNCWANSANQMLMSMIDKPVVQQIREKVYQGEFRVERSAVRDAVLELWQACDDIRSGREKPHSVAGYQMTLMRALHVLGQKDPENGTIKNLFGSEKPSLQEDPQEYLSAICSLLGMNEMPEYSINAQTRIKANVNGKAIARPCGMPAQSCVISMPRPEKLSPVRMLEQAFGPAYSHMYSKYNLPEHEQIASDLYELHQLLRNHREEDGVNNIRKAERKLLGTVQALAERCVDHDVPIVYEAIDRQGAKVLVLESDCYFQNGKFFRQGTVLGKAPDAPFLSEFVGDLGPGNKDAWLDMQMDGSIILVSRDQIDTKYTKGVAVVDQQGRLTRPMVAREYDGRFVKDDECIKLKPGTEILSHEGKTIAPKGQVPAGALVMRRKMAELVKGRNLESMTLVDTQVLCQEIGAMLAVSDYLDMRPVSKAYAPSTIGESLGTLLKGVHTSKSEWSKEELDKAGAAITDWYPMYLQQQDINEQWVVNKAQSQGCRSLAECYQWHYDSLAKKTDVKIPAVTSNALEMNTAKNRQFMVSLKIFDTDMRGRTTKTAKDAKEIFASMGNKIRLPVINERGEEASVEAKVKHLVCHKGQTADFGHYISLRFLPRGQIIVEDDTKVMELNDYLRFEGRQSADGKTTSQILESLNLEPYVMLVERTDS